MTSDTSMSIPLLRDFHIPSLPPDFYYIPNFITEEEEASILQKIPSQRWITLSHRRLQAHPSTLTVNNTLLGAPLPPYLVDPIVARFRAIGVFQNTPHKTPNHVLINEYKKGEGIMPHEDGSAYAHVVATVSLGSPICLQITAKKATEESERDPQNDSHAITDDIMAATPTSVHPSRKETDKQGVDSNVSVPWLSPYKVPTRILQEPRSLLITTGRAYTDLLHGISSIDVDDGLNSETVANWTLLAEPELFEDGRNERATRVSLTYRDVLKVSSAAGKVLGMLGRR